MAMYEREIDPTIAARLSSAAAYAVLIELAPTRSERAPTITGRKEGAIGIPEPIRGAEMPQRLQAELAHAARASALAELTASVAFAFNQPLAALMINVETALRWLDRAEPDVSKAQEVMQRALDDVHRVADIVARIRAMEAGQAPQPTALALNEVS
jgi:C4-dicarboxylate-specific signal transduction histidine kinase